MILLKLKSKFKKPDIIYHEYIPSTEVYDLIQRQKLKYKIKTYNLDELKSELLDDLHNQLKIKHSKYYIKFFTVEFKNLYLIEIKGEIYL